MTRLRNQSANLRRTDKRCFSRYVRDRSRIAHDIGSPHNYVARDPVDIAARPNPSVLPDGLLMTTGPVSSPPRPARTTTCASLYLFVCPSVARGLSASSPPLAPLCRSVATRVRSARFVTRHSSVGPSRSRHNLRDGSSRNRFVSR